jgi:hypothetical protein
LFIKLHGAWGDVTHPVLMASLGMAARHPEQARDGVFGDVHQAGGGPHPASFAQMIDDGGCLFLRNLGIEQRGATSCGALLAAGAAAQEPETILAVYCAHREIILARATKLLAVVYDPFRAFS